MAAWIAPRFRAEGPASLFLDEDGVTLSAQDKPYGPSTETVITDQRMDWAVWSPYGDAFFLSNPSGTWLNGTEQILDVGGAMHFTLNGRNLVVSTSDGWTFVDFEPVDPPDDSEKISNWSTLTSAGLGPVRIGMTVNELEAVLGSNVTFDALSTPPGELQEGQCVSINAEVHAGVRMLGSATGDGSAVLTRIYAEGPWRTPSGLQIGNPEADVFAKLPDQVDVRHHAYDTSGFYLTFQPSDPTDPNTVRFITGHGRIRAISVGDREWIRLVEGCA